MKSAKKNLSKTYEVSQRGLIVVYPSIREANSGGRLRHLLRILKRLRKGH